MQKIFIFVLMTFLCFFFCKKESFTEPEPEPEPENNTPRIVSIRAIPSVVEAGEGGSVDSMLVTVRAYDKDMDDLTFTFSAEEGILGKQSRYDIIYTPPPFPGDYIVSCIVSDGQDTVSKFVTVSVSQPDPEYEFAPETILINRHLTVLLGPSWDPRYRDQLKAVTLEPYRIAKYELTNIEYYQFVKEGGYDNASWWSEAGWKTKIDSGWTGPMYWGSTEPPWLDDPYSHLENTPVHGINFYEAEAYCNYLSNKTSITYRIPNRFQWQRAAKGPDPGYKYPWGNEFVDEYMHFIVFNLPELLPVNSIPEGQSQDRCFHMVGNVFEYVSPVLEFETIMPGNNVGKVYEYSIHLKKFDNERLIIIFYSLPVMFPNDTNDIKRAMTTSSWSWNIINVRYYGYGVRISREY